LKKNSTKKNKTITQIEHDFDLLEETPKKRRRRSKVVKRPYFELASDLLFEKDLGISSPNVSMAVMGGIQEELGKMEKKERAQYYNKVRKIIDKAVERTTPSPSSTHFKNETLDEVSDTSTNTPTKFPHDNLINDQIVTSQQNITENQTETQKESDMEETEEDEELLRKGNQMEEALRARVEIKELLNEGSTLAENVVNQTSWNPDTVLSEELFGDGSL